MKSEFTNEKIKYSDGRIRIPQVRAKRGQGLRCSDAGFTLTEVLVVIGIFLVLAVMTVLTFRVFEKESYLNNSAEEIVSGLRLARNKTLASEMASQYGVYFDDTTTPHQYTLFKGASYATREVLSDAVSQLPKAVEIYEINLGGEKEVVFKRISGETSQAGNLKLRLINDPAKTKIIYIENSGQISLVSSIAPLNGRIKDARHVHFDYIRVIATTTEKLTLTLDTTVTKEIIIADHLKDGQIYWEEGVDVNGEIQKLKIHTHRLNNPDTQFCVHRDRRYNNKALTITISGDGSGDLISYTSEGQESRGTSIFLAAGGAGDPQRQ